ncbi:hypothetical protein [Hydrogenophaga atypica]
MNTDLKQLLALSMPTFAYTKLERFADHEYRASGVPEIEHSFASVDLSQVAGTTHPVYGGRSWIDLLGNPPGGEFAELQHIRRYLRYMVENPSYYTKDEKKPGWSFYLVDGRYYIGDGSHRTVIGRFLLSLNGLPTTVSGVLAGR